MYTKDMPKFINPFTDIGFKRIFGQVLDKEQIPLYEEDRMLIYDIYCTDQNGEQFIVEMQNKGQIHFRERALYYLSQAVARQGERGVDWRFDLKAVYGVFFMNFRPDWTTRKLRTDIVLADRDTHEQFSDKMRYIFLELPSFTKEENECENDFERWIYVLKNMETLQRLPFKARNAVFRKLEQIVDIASLSKEDRMKYDESIKAYRDKLVVTAYAEETGWARGREEGLSEGLEKGIQQGLSEGKLEVARNMKADGFPTETITRYTGLAPEVIERL